jgi:hypothetical protein
MAGVDTGLLHGLWVVGECMIYAVLVRMVWLFLFGEFGWCQIGSFGLDTGAGVLERSVLGIFCFCLIDLTVVFWIWMGV